MLRSQDRRLEFRVPSCRAGLAAAGLAVRRTAVWRAVVLAAALATVAASTIGPPPAAAQPFAYEIRLLPRVPGSYSTFGLGLNESGTVVGQTLVGDPLELKAWVWTEEAGIEVLPPPPGLDDYAAVDVNNAGVVAGDGGYDWGEAWRYADGVYEMLGTLPGDPMSTASGINEAGDVAGTSKHPSFTQPRNSFYAPAGGQMFLVQPDSYAGYLNEAGQVVGYVTSNTAYLYDPDSGTLILPPLGGRVLTWATSINDAGVVVGEAAQANGNGHVPFIYTAADGMQQIGNFGGSAGASDVNNRGEVVGDFNAGGPHPWIWTAASGLRFLANLFDPASGIQLLSVRRINEDGVVLGQALDLVTGDRHPFLLSPSPIFADGFESGDTSSWSGSGS